MRNGKVKIMVAGMIVLVMMTGCGLKGSGAGGESSNNTPTPIDRDDSGYHAGKQENESDAGDSQSEGNNLPESQPQEAEKIEEELAAYRAEREKGTSTIGNYTMVSLPNEEEYNYGIGNGNSYTSRFDAKELNEAFKTAGLYVKDKLNLQSEAWPCIDPRVIAIYEDKDKGVANGYDADNIFICEYNDNGSWQYLVLVRERKGSDWKVIHHGSSYKTN